MSVPAAALSPGTLVLGRYRPLKPLGSGGAGSVWLARDEEHGRDVALKIVSREGTLGPRAEREAAAAAQLRHERCLRAYAHGRGIVHRDVKPANVLLEESDGVSIRILDFGLELTRAEETLMAGGDI